jgi:hypothetical protein
MLEGSLEPRKLDPDDAANVKSVQASRSRLSSVSTGLVEQRFPLVDGELAAGAGDDVALAVDGDEVGER